MKPSISFKLLGLSLSTFAITPIVGAADAPHFENNLLTIPTVNTDTGVGSLQDVLLRLEESGVISLLELRDGVQNSSISEVSHLLTDSFPTQVFIQLSGSFTSGCPETGQINARLIENNFEISAYLRNNAWLLDPTTIACAAVIVPFNTIFPLDVYGLEAGEYSYTINENFHGSFTLSEDNFLVELNQ